jgi:DNA polymerase-3 subunit epsilon
MVVREASFAAIDFESAGVTRGSTDAPVQIGLAVMETDTSSAEDQMCLRQDFSFRSFLQTDQPIVWSAQKVHGISSADLVGAPTLTSLWPRLNQTLRHRVVVAHGAGTEKRFLRNFPLHGFKPWVDTLKVAQAAFPDQRDFSLESLSLLTAVTEETRLACPGLKFHDALFDATATLLVLREIIRAAALGRVPLDALIHPERSAYFARRRRER